jgi:hypothetical protein
MDASLPLYRSKIGIAFLSWHGLAVLCTILSGLAGGHWNFAETLLLWTALSVALYLVRPRFFILVGITLAVLEESLIFSFGGGLQGKAPSLAYDLAATLPVFAGFILGWFISLKVQPWSETALYIGAGLHGFVLEFVTTGLMWHLTAVLYLGGPMFFIYGSLVLVPRPPDSRESRKPSILQSFGLWLLTLLMMILGAVVADHLLHQIQ